MKWHLNFQPEKSLNLIQPEDALFLAGSCFSTHIAEKLISAGFTVGCDPSGNNFNPFSIANGIEAVMNNAAVESKFITQRDTHFVTFEAHSDVCAESETDLIAKFQNMRQLAQTNLKSARFLFISFGTAFYYEHIQLKTIVANCHKKKQTDFEKKLATPEEIVSRYESLLQNLKLFNPKLKVVFTISPVRHLKDGITENNLSKSILRYALHLICAKQKDVTYFPAFELINDDLKDYRFYSADLAHPNDLAINYVWEKFSETFFSEKTLKLAKLFEEKSKALAHRQDHSVLPDPRLQSHIQKLEKQIEDLKKA